MHFSICGTFFDFDFDIVNVTEFTLVIAVVCFARRKTASEMEADQSNLSKFKVEFFELAKKTVRSAKKIVLG